MKEGRVDNIVRECCYKSSYEGVLIASSNTRPSPMLDHRELSDRIKSKFTRHQIQHKTRWRVEAATQRNPACRMRVYKIFSYRSVPMTIISAQVLHCSRRINLYGQLFISENVIRQRE